MSWLRLALVLVVACGLAAAWMPGDARAADAAAAADAHADGHGGGHRDPNPLVLDPDLAVWTFVIFLVLMAVLWKFAWGPISKALDQREQRIADAIAAAEQSSEDAKRLLADYEAKLASAREEVRAILDEARRDAEHTGQEILAKARADAQLEFERGKREIETATAQALKELAESTANVAIELAGQIVSTKLDASEHARIIEQAMASFPTGDAARN